MKKLHRIFLLTCTLLAGTYLAAQDGELPEPSLNMRYFNVNGNLQYLKVNALVKEDNRLVPVIGESEPLPRRGHRCQPGGTVCYG